MVVVGRPTAVVSLAALLFPRPTVPRCLQPPSHRRSAGWTAIILSQRLWQWIKSILVGTDEDGRYRRRRSILFWPSLGFAVLTIGTIMFMMNGASFFHHGTTKRYYDGMVQQLNLLLGTKRPGQGREVRAVLPITVRPTYRTTPFVGRRCQMTESSSFFRVDDHYWWRGGRRGEDRSSSWISIDCEECTADGHCFALSPRDGVKRPPPPAVVDASLLTMAHVTSQYNPQSAEPIAFWKVVSLPNTAANDQRQKQQQQQQQGPAVYNFHPNCSIEACWDLQRCRRQQRDETTNDTEGGDFFVMTVHVLALPSSTFSATTPSDLVERFTRALLEPNHMVEMVANPQDACLVVVVLSGMAADGPAASNDYDDDDDNVATTTIDDAAAMIGNGQNLLVWDVVSIFGESSPSHAGLHFGKAAIASRHIGWTPAWMRLGYDIVLPPLDYHAAEPKTTTVDSTLAHSGKVLLACAVITTAGDAGWAAYIARQYWQDDPDGGGGQEETFAAIQPLCQQMDPDGPSDHAAMANATFTLLPDENPSTLLFPTIAMGSIPVVMNLEMLPFWPDVPFDQCVYLVDLTRIVDLPRLLGQVSAAEIQERRSICRRLGRRVFGDDAVKKGVDRDAHSFMVAVSTMRERISRAQQLRSALERS
jgi:hypothetical protein